MSKNGSSFIWKNNYKQLNRKIIYFSNIPQIKGARGTNNESVIVLIRSL